jgi:hypothetical protein
MHNECLQLLNQAIETLEWLADGSSHDTADVMEAIEYIRNKKTKVETHLNTGSI